MSAIRKRELLVFPAAPAAGPSEADRRFLALWLAERPKTTVDAYTFEAERFLGAVGCGLGQLRAVEQLEPWFDSLVGLSSRSVRRARSAVKGLLGFAFRLGRCPVDLGAAIRLPALPRKLPRIVERAEIIRVIDSEPHEFRRLVLRGYYLHGFRVSELTGASWGDLTAKDGGLWLLVTGKGGKQRAVQLSAGFAADLLAVRPAGWAVDGRIVNRNRTTVWRWVKRLGAACGYPQLSTHWLRHCCASHLLDRHVPIHVVQELLGHASVSTTTAYLHALPEARPADALEW